MTSAELRRMADEAEHLEGEQTIEAVCQIVGVGVRALLSADRSEEVARKRRVVAWILCERLKWTRKRAAKALRRSEKQVKRMVLREK